MSKMLQRMQQAGTELNSATLMRTLLQAHAVLIATPESFAALAGNMSTQPFHPILQVEMLSKADPCFLLYIGHERSLLRTSKLGPRAISAF